MPPPPELQSAALALARARRFLLLGRPGPWYGRAAADGIPEADAAEHGAAAVQACALLEEAEPLDEALRALQRPAVERPNAARQPPLQALAALAYEDDPDERDGLARAAVRALPGPIEAAGAVFAAAAERAAEQNAATLAPSEDLAAAAKLLTATDDPARDVLEWASLKLGRPRRAKLSWTDIVRVLRQPPLDAALRPAHDPWPALRAWRESLGLSTDLRFERSGAACWGSWALRLGGRLVAGAAAWPGALLWRFALQALGRADALREGGLPALLPADSGSAELLAALYPPLLGERAFLDRAVKLRPSATPDDVRKLALSEILLARLQAAALMTQQAFEAARALEPLRDIAADAFRRALYVPLPPEVGLLFCRPWAPPLASPRAALAAAVLNANLRERYDVDWWRNPRSAPELRRIAAGAAEAKLEELVPGGDGVAAYRSWALERLGG